MNYNNEPTVSVGIMEADSIRLTLHGEFLDGNGSAVSGELTVAEPIELRPTDNGCRATLHDVVIGKNFHWQQRMEQLFEGSFRIVRAPNGHLIAINDLGVEKYLRSVISSEMNANAPLEFLKAHAVISRSWLLAQMQHSRKPQCEGMVSTDHELIKWYDRDDHALFDVCADDHCQRYQGVRENMPQTVAMALEQTQGEVLTYDGVLCDARFSKCCGGVMERFSTCWGNEDMVYLAAKRDSNTHLRLPDLTDEQEARQWCLSTPQAWCAEATPQLLARVLNGYDLDTADFYRWRVEYSAGELAAVLHEKSGIDFGMIKSIVPLHRGPSARIDRLEIVGTKRSMIVGKELEIRKWLSKSHLYSSAFAVDALDPDTDGIPRRWVFNGAGWGHGVGLCQIGAAAMADAGKQYRDILSHYYPESAITVLY